MTTTMEQILGKPAKSPLPIDNSLQGVPDGSPVGVQQPVNGVQSSDKGTVLPQNNPMSVNRNEANNAEQVNNGVTAPAAADMSTTTNPAAHTIVSMDGNPDHGVMQDKLKQYTGWDGTETPEEKAAKETRQLYYDNMFKILDENSKEYKPETPEEKEKRIKKEKRQAMWAAIGDGVSSLANLYFTSKGAPNAYNTDKSMLKTLEERREKMRKQREEDKEKYLNAAIRKLQLADDTYKQEQADKDRKYAMINAARRAENEEREMEWKQRFYDAKTQNQQAQTDKTSKEAAALDDINKAKIELVRAQTKAQKAAAQAHLANAQESLAKARNVGKDGNGSKKYYGSTYVNGKLTPFTTEADYNRAVVAEAKRLNIPLQTSGEKDAYGNIKNRKNRTIDGLAAEIEVRHGISGTVGQKDSKRKGGAFSGFSIHK